MKVLICVPSKGRPYEMPKLCMDWLPYVGVDFKIFVEPQEYIHYKLTCGKENVVDIGANDKGLGYCVNFYANYAIEHGYDLLFRIDDDITHWGSKFIGNGKKGHTVQIFRSMMDDVLPDFEKDEKLGAVRFVSTRYHIFEAIGKNRKYTHRNDEVWNSSIVKPHLAAMLDENITTSDDACLTCFIIANGYYILTYGRCGINPKLNTNSGGFQAMDRRQMTIDTFNYIVQKFPLVKLRENKTWFGLDLDVSAYATKEIL